MSTNGASRTSATSGTQSVDRAADLLARVVLADEAPTFTELVVHTELARSTVSRLLTALERADLLARTEDGAFLPGRLFELYAAGRDRYDRLVEASREVMSQLGEATGETINLGVARAGAVVQVAQVDSTYFLGSRDWVGVDVPAHTSALGKVLYAHGALAVPEGPLEALAPATVTTGRELGRQLTGIRKQGWAATVDELELGLTGIAAPVTINGEIVAALGLSGPTSRLADHLTATGQVVARHARTLSNQLGRQRKEGAA